MKWLLMWLNVSVATLNATLQLLVIYRLVDCIMTGGSITVHLIFMPPKLVKYICSAKQFANPMIWKYYILYRSPKFFSIQFCK